MDYLFRHRRNLVPKRTSELVALMAISTTLFLFLHTRDLHSKLKQMEVKLTNPGELTANQISGGESGLANYINMLKDSSALSSLNVHSLNNTRNADMDIMFFNRVPKVGSQTFMELLRRLSNKNLFEFHRDEMHRVETIRMAPDDQNSLANVITNFNQPSVYIKHICFINFTSFNLPQPIYVNIVRDPIERVISWYYYVRAPWYYVERKQAFPDLPLPDPRWLKKDYETCVLQGDRECRYVQGETREGIGDHRRQTLFFCGHSEDCTPFNSAGVLEQAKMTVEKNYAVVGVLEDLNTTLTVLERYIPRFFKGAPQLFRDEVDRFTKINKNNFKPQVSEEIKEIVRRNFTREIEFYQFCRQRLHRQLLALRLLDEGST